MRHNLLLLVLAILVLANCSTPPKEEVSNAPIPIDTLFEAFHDFRLRINPVEATKAGYNEFNSEIANFISDDYKNELIQQYNEFLAAITKHEQSQMTDADRLSLKVMKWDCEVKLEGLQNELVTIPSPMFDLPNFQLMPITQSLSFNLYVGTMANGEGLQPFKTVEDYENWLERVDDYLIWMDTAVENMNKGASQGVIWPKTILKKVIEQVRPFANPNDHLFLGPIDKMPDSFSVEDKDRLTKAYEAMVKEKVAPAYQKLLSHIQKLYYVGSRETAGIGQLPNGPETYQYLIKYHTTTNMTPDEIFELGQVEVTRIRGEMEKVKSDVGYEGSLEEFFNHVRANEDLMPFKKPKQVIASFNDILKRVESNLDQLFSIAPKAGFEVRRTEAFREKSASAEYVPGSKDGSRPGVFYVPIPDVEAYNVFADEALFLHEAIPGHHYQLSLQQENEDLPAFLHAEGMGVFVEGWALYSESLGKELGLYEDPYQYFGMLSMEMHRAIRLVVDVGIHAKGWTREQAIQFSLENEAESEASIISEIERYMVNPGQALSYKIGQLKIQGLRAMAAERLGDKFDLKEFHSQVLNSGSLPLVLLEEKINSWCEQVEKGV